MERARAAFALLLAAGLALAACRERPAPAVPQATAVLGGSAPAAGQPASAALTDAHGQAIPPPPLPAGTEAQLVRTGDESALAVWVQEGRVLAASFDRAQGWGSARPLEQIYGVASEPRIAANGRGSALAVWRHTVGNIQSLRYSRYEAASGWSAPDVVPGALPRPPSLAAGRRDAPQLQMDAQGNVTAQWPSGFDPAEIQVARFAPGQGWSRAVSQRVASAPAASPASPPASSAR
jgi:hypothetical protein